MLVQKQCLRTKSVKCLILSMLHTAGSRIQICMSSAGLVLQRQYVTTWSPRVLMSMPRALLASRRFFGLPKLGTPLLYTFCFRYSKAPCFIFQCTRCRHLLRTASRGCLSSPNHAPREEFINDQQQVFSAPECDTGSGNPTNTTARYPSLPVPVHHAGFGNADRQTSLSSQVCSFLYQQRPLSECTPRYFMRGNAAIFRNAAGPRPSHRLAVLWLQVGVYQPVVPVSR